MRMFKTPRMTTRHYRQNMPSLGFYGKNGLMRAM
jgi:hypothetical protein